MNRGFMFLVLSNLLLLFNRILMFYYYLKSIEIYQ
jgi:hypothetical protein